MPYFGESDSDQIHVFHTVGRKKHRERRQGFVWEVSWSVLVVHDGELLETHRGDAGTTLVFGYNPHKSDPFYMVYDHNNERAHEPSSHAEECPETTRLLLSSPVVDHRSLSSLFLSVPPAWTVSRGKKHGGGGSELVSFSYTAATLQSTVDTLGVPLCLGSLSDGSYVMRIFSAVGLQGGNGSTWSFCGVDGSSLGPNLEIDFSMRRGECKAGGEQTVSDVCVKDKGLDTGSSSSNSLELWIGGSVACLFALAVVVVAVFMKRRKQQQSLVSAYSSPAITDRSYLIVQDGEEDSNSVCGDGSHNGKASAPPLASLPAKTRKISRNRHAPSGTM